jgi:hypothetical protein
MQSENIGLLVESAIDVRIKSSAGVLTFYTKGYPYQPNWGIIGGNPKGWDASTDMTYNAANWYLFISWFNYWRSLD